MNCGPRETKVLLDGLKKQLSESSENVEILVCPPFISLPSATERLADMPVNLGAQNVHFEDDGAFTGEISTKMLTEVGCDYVIAGHSERRDYFIETDEMINLKARKALQTGMKPIICVGEFDWQREENEHQAVVENQVTDALVDVESEAAKNVVIAYEPIWAIGTGETATPAQAEEMHKVIREKLTALYGEDVSEAVQILYGGSMKPHNAKELLSQPNVDGGLIGGASLKAQSFAEIIDIAKELA